MPLDDIDQYIQYFFWEITSEWKITVIYEIKIPLNHKFSTIFFKFKQSFVVLFLFASWNQQFIYLIFSTHNKVTQTHIDTHKQRKHKSCGKVFVAPWHIYLTVIFRVFFYLFSLEKNNKIWANYVNIMCEKHKNITINYERAKHM